MEPVPLDLKTVRIVKEVLDDAWYSLSAEQQAMMSKKKLAESAFSCQRLKASATASAYLLSPWRPPNNDRTISLNLTDFHILGRLQLSRQFIGL